MPAPIAAQQAKPKHHKYRLVDIGTFGGPFSYINPADQSGSTNQVNSLGMTVGGAATSIPTTQTSNGFVCFGLGGGGGPFISHAMEWTKRAVKDLGALPGGDLCSVATSVSSSGEIVGYSENDVIDPLLGLNAIRGVVWKRGKIKRLPTFGGDLNVAVIGNDRGQITGCTTNNVPDPYSIFYFQIAGLSNGSQTRAFLWREGSIHDLGTLGGPDACSYSLNEQGEVVGGAYTNNIPNSTTGIPTEDPFLWIPPVRNFNNAKMIDLGTLGGTFGAAFAVNSHGHVIGESNLTGDTTFHPFLWTSSKGMTDLKTFGGSTGTANAINNAGEVVGVADLQGDQDHDAFLWRKGHLIDLGNLGSTSSATSINSSSQIVGGSHLNAVDQGAFLWENGGPMVDLNDLIHPTLPFD
jgi:probable HAF family extracellular repeat protein